eukprot:GILJ01012398.1.p1 GENE.GILJ01012398.1~~GILJ01012398.1.p1  ORF type:complete len:452 (-),score=32.68 GILJ01012398.1:123-1478(-)
MTTPTNSTNFGNLSKPVVTVVIPMAGAGSRFAAVGYVNPKPLIDVVGRPMIERVVNNMTDPTREMKFIFIVQHSHRHQYHLDDLLQRVAPGCHIVEVNGITEGAACTVLTARNLVDPAAPLLIVNSDQWLEWDVTAFLQDADVGTADSVISTFECPALEAKWSYARVDPVTGLVTEVQEKNPISTHATTGAYWWRRGGDFITSADKMIAKNIRVNNEFYVCPVYNQALEPPLSLAVKTATCRRMWGIGTPEDLSVFLDAVRHGQVKIPCYPHNYKFIAHRGNTTGPCPDLENRPDYIEAALAQGFFVEVDLWCLADNGENQNQVRDDEQRRQKGQVVPVTYWLGHDGPQYPITADLLLKWSDRLYVHAKNEAALLELQRLYVLNFFFHDKDAFTLTSQREIWAYPRPAPWLTNSITVMPELCCSDVQKMTTAFDHRDGVGVCSDWVALLRQ